MLAVTNCGIYVSTLPFGELSHLRWQFSAILRVIPRKLRHVGYFVGPEATVTITLSEPSKSGKASLRLSNMGNN